MQFRNLSLALTLVLSSLLAGCGERDAATGAATAPAPAPAATPAPAAPAPVSAPTVAAPAAPALRAMVQVQPTSGHTAAGTLQLAVVDGAVHITGQLTGLEPNGSHGFHVHQVGDCSAPDASSAGDHFNPDGAAHGAPNTPPHHAGDLGNITADASGNATLDLRFQQISLGGGAANDVIGKSVVVHAQADDLSSQPSGNAGARIACGVIQPGA